METPLEALVERARQGDKDALESVVRAIMDRVYGLAIRMLAHDEDAEDATQEILIRIITHLGTFRGESAFSSWVYRVASNHLLNTRRRRAERYFVSLEAIGQQVETALGADRPYVAPEAERELLVKETMLGCLHAVLVALKRDLRLAYILGDVIGVTSAEGAYILDISATAFRKRLSRARTLLVDFMREKCGLVRTSNPCRCENQVSYAIQSNCINPRRLMFSPQDGNRKDASLSPTELEEMDELQRIAALFRSLPHYSAPETVLASLKTIVDMRV